MAFKIAGSMAFKQAAAEAEPYLLEPIVRTTITVPEEAWGTSWGTSIPAAAARWASSRRVR